MSTSLVRKSLEICDSSTGDLHKKGDKHLRKLQKLSKKERNSTRVKSVAEAIKRMRSADDSVEENLKKLVTLGSLDVKEDIAKKLLSRAGKLQEEKKVEEKPKETVFTEEDFEKFEKEYFVS